MLLEYPEVEERRVRLAGLKGIEDRVWVQVEGCERVYAIADEDLERENEEKTSSVHFLRFELSGPMCRALRSGAGLSVGADHPNYHASVAVGPETRNALAGDLS